MLFNSLLFLCIYLPVVTIGYHALARALRQASLVWLIFASLFFYGWWDSRYVLLLVASILFNYLIGCAISTDVQLNKKGRAKFFAILGVFLNLAILAYYKYFNFFCDSLNEIGVLDFRVSDVVLPLGVSFFTFTQIAFLVDSYQGKVRESKLSNYFLFVTYFPHLIAGPVLHHAQMMPQFDRVKPGRLDFECLVESVIYFSIGLFKKVVVADGISAFVSPVFSAAAKGYEPGFYEANSAAFCYTIQLYFDFSGYSDMAIGLSLLFSVRLPVNFNSPYKSANIIEFWRRWHMTLSAFLRDYLYVPLGGGREGTAKRLINIWITMVLGGLWHGAGWTFVLWGGGHGLLLMLNHGWRILQNASTALGAFRIPIFLSRLITFYSVVLLWVVFRADDLWSAKNMLAGMIGANGFSTSFPVANFNWIFWPLIVVFFCPNSQQWVEILQRWTQTVDASSGLFARSRWVVVAFVFAWIFWWGMVNINNVSEFLYFQF